MKREKVHKRGRSNTSSFGYSFFLCLLTHYQITIGSTLGGIKCCERKLVSENSSLCKTTEQLAEESVSSMHTHSRSN
jgi:hypothetical protein